MGFGDTPGRCAKYQQTAAAGKTGIPATTAVIARAEKDRSAKLTKTTATVSSDSGSEATGSRRASRQAKRTNLTGSWKGLQDTAVKTPRQLKTRYPDVGEPFANVKATHAAQLNCMCQMG